MSRRPKHDPKESEREILRAAEEFLREHPFRDMTVEAVMSRTGLKRPAFYAHFRDRHDLALRVVDEMGGELREMVDRWLQGDDLVNDARAAFEGLADVYTRHGPVLSALSDAAGSDEKVEAAYQGMVQGFIDATAHQIRVDQARGRISEHIDTLETARALVWMDERYLTQALGRTPRADPARVVDVLYNIWMSALYGQVPQRVTGE
ncbi:TetR/AcrR family transcriptional regulator [Mycobacterium talmoniae]|uniref:HTH-type transcriptional regulator EthR n=1 Tax=Mycobacterium talmoniae TaxID=1858794 RepID=A0A1S1NIY3_9MYCO|nr:MULTISPECIES: TetR/AcrR family transcriptional regulator [Mycobacterium]OHV00005.1 TetR family transcriptional regulator [Mycobacterium talmoniae]PQM45085.1 HTH-type transcriptional regulator EthR [Mycobacterium talmoniae]TDH55975.1 TetR/AcrR family transcriptional regulator [Mycobacterium eburneum]